MGQAVVEAVAGISGPGRLEPVPHPARHCTGPESCSTGLGRSTRPAPHVSLPCGALRSSKPTVCCALRTSELLANVSLRAGVLHSSGYMVCGPAWTHALHTVISLPGRALRASDSTVCGPAWTHALLTKYPLPGGALRCSESTVCGPFGVHALLIEISLPGGVSQRSEPTVGGPVWTRALHYNIVISGIFARACSAGAEVGRGGGALQVDAARGAGADGAHVALGHLCPSLPLL